MTEYQPKLLKPGESVSPNSDGQNPSGSNGPVSPSIGGPIFEFGPGWGTKIKRWLKKYVLASDCPLCRNTRYVLIAGVIILIFFRPQLKPFTNQKEPVIATTTINTIVQKGDSKTTVARRILADYLKSSQDLSLSAGQKVFVETKMVKLMANVALQVGQTVELRIEDVHKLGHQAESLSPSALKKWEGYARHIKF